MPELAPPPEETPGQHCARWLKSAKAKAQETNTILTWVEVAKIIDATLAGLKYFDHVKAPQPAVEAQNSEIPTPRDIYDAYPRHVAPKSAIKAITKASKELTASTEGGTLIYLLARTKLFAAAVKQWDADDRQYIPHPATWFNRGSYSEDASEWTRGTRPAATQKDYSKI